MSETFDTPAADYDAESIRVLEDREAVRERPGMYIGDTGRKGAHHCLWEIVDNSIDEHMGGHCDKIHVTLHKDGSASVQDNGRGIPIRPHPDPKFAGKSAATVAVTVLHAGGKFANTDSKAAYKTSGGLHGVGASVVNFLSTNFEMTIERDGGRFFQAFIDGGREVAPLDRIGNTRGPAVHGTLVHFKLDRTIFRDEEGEPSPELDPSVIRHSLMTRAHLNPGLEITFVVEKFGDLADNHTESWNAQSFAQILDVISSNDSPLVLPALSAVETIQTAKGDVGVMVAFRVHATGRASVISSFANNIITPQHGQHEAGFRSALLRAYNKYAEDNKLTKEAFTSEDVREGLDAAIAVRVTEPRFAGQTKDKLANTECNGAVASVTYQLITKFFEENPKEAKIAIARAERSAKANAAAEAARDKVERKSDLNIGSLPGKLADCQDTDPTVCELYIVEGDSAGGSAKQGRDRKFQAILPIKGKSLNIQKSDLVKALASQEVINIVKVLGCGAGPSFDISKLKYHKVINMTDADVDGAHINCLLLTLYHNLMPGLIEAGHVYAAMPPLYRLNKGKGDPIWIQNEAALEAFFVSRPNEDEKAWTKQRFKGLGEMNPDQLWETTMDPAQRSLVQIRYSDFQIEDASGENKPSRFASRPKKVADAAELMVAAAAGGADEAQAEASIVPPPNAAHPEEATLSAADRDEWVFELLMGPDVPPRREFIETNAVYAQLDI